MSRGALRVFAAAGALAVLALGAKTLRASQAPALASEDGGVDARDQFGATALINAAAAGETKQVWALIASSADVDAADNSGDTALILAARNDRADAVKALIAAKADVNVQDTAGDTALSAAVWGGYADVAAALVGAGARLGAPPAFAPRVPDAARAAIAAMVTMVVPEIRTRG